ncbi:hypothetical protein BDZ89DRAFT_1240180 [Hymenopellis radicata]|nr:hypothetical protein BDZ89DRAFT_1240180 [Hymenopellis radicata]
MAFSHAEDFDRLFDAPVAHIHLLLATNDSADSAVWLLSRPSTRSSSVPVTLTLWTFVPPPRRYAPRRETPSPQPGQVAKRRRRRLGAPTRAYSSQIYDTMERFNKSFELQRPMRSKPLPAVRTWHRRILSTQNDSYPIPGLKKQPALDSDSDSDSDYVP